jgi:anti-sigma factor RsiW
MTDMACNELVEEASDYLEGALPAAERERFEAHLAECPFCTTYLEQMRATVAALGTPARDRLSEDARAGVLDAFRRRLPGE